MTEDRREPDRSRQASLLFYGSRIARTGSGAAIEPRTLIYFGSMIVLVGLACWLYLYQATETTRTAAEIRDLLKQQQRLHLDLVALSAEVALEGAMAPVAESVDGTKYAYSAASDDHHRLNYTPKGEVETSTAELSAADAEQAPGAITDLAAVWRSLVRQVDDWLGQPVTP